MSTASPVSLRPSRILPEAAEYRSLIAWPFAAEPFFESQVTRLLETDIPQRDSTKRCLVWIYHDPDGSAVGFGTLDVGKEYERFSDGKFHTYIPLLAVHPQFQKRGHGRRIVQHLIAEAISITESSPNCSDLLFLDVYTANKGAIALYEKSGFIAINPDTPILDPHEKNETYIIMAKKISVASM
jgi:ribosomal protein S18 acetylase RimI-like enzyme